MKCLAIVLLPPALLAALFLAFPDLDLRAARLLLAPDGTFLLSDNAFIDSVRQQFVGLLALGLFLGGALAWLASWWPGAPLRLRALRRAAAFVALVQLLGPGLLVNVVFKDQWGRARPHQVQAFGGELRFTPAWQPSDQCHKNCSFVSGDASVGFGLIALAWVTRRRGAWFAAGLAVGAALGVMRMAQGSHFLSDVIFSFYAVWFVAWALARWLLPVARPRPWLHAEGGMPRARA
jgi:lipid A 4'-phosphatase